MNDSTLPLPRIGASAARSKVPRKKGFGLSDWNRLVANSKDLALRNGEPLRKIKWDEIRKHNSVHDGWIVLKGKVYFLSPYLAYHPGGETILKNCLGKDATAVYDKYHRWVNEDGYVDKICVRWSKDDIASFLVAGNVVEKDGRLTLALATLTLYYTLNLLT
jgi:cytochrome b involved in lipid metabolism